MQPTRRIHRRTSSLPLVFAASDKFSEPEIYQEAQVLLTPISNTCQKRNELAEIDESTANPPTPKREIKRERQRETQSEIIPIFMDPSHTPSIRSKSSTENHSSQLSQMARLVSQNSGPAALSGCVEIVKAKHALICDFYLSERRYAADLQAVYSACNGCRVAKAKQLLFGNLPDIISVTNKLIKVMERLVPPSVLYSGRGSSFGSTENCSDSATHIGDAMCILLSADMYQAYERYIDGHSRRILVLEQAETQVNSELGLWFAERQKALYFSANIASISHVCMSPAGHVARYSSVLTTLSRLTLRTHADFHQIDKARRRAHEFLQLIKARLEPVCELLKNSTG